MLIDWFTVGAQVLNFLILVWLMKRFLYRPILVAIDTRETRIASELADADAKRAEAQAQRDAFEHKNATFDQQRAELLSKATAEAGEERQRLLDEARAAAAALSVKRQDALRSEAHSLNETIRRRTGHEVFAIARKALTDLASTSLEERMSEVFIGRLRALDGSAKDRLAAALANATEPVSVRSAFELPDAQRTLVQQALDQTFPGSVWVRFETAPELISGIELSVSGQALAWSIDDYLVSLEQEVSELLDQKAVARSSDDESSHSPAVATGT